MHSANSPSYALGVGLGLQELLTEIGPHIATSPGPLPSSSTVHRIELYDSLDGMPGEPGSLLLVPSFGTASPPADDISVRLHRIADLARRARATSVAAIALKCRDEEARAVGEIATASGIPMLRVSEGVSWRIFDAIVSKILGEQGLSEDVHRTRGTEPLFDLTNELAAFFGGSVVIEDLGRRIIAYSSVQGQLIDRIRTQGILTRRVPDSPFNDDQYRTVLRSDEPVRFPRLGDEEPRLAYAIRAGAFPLGTIWAIDASKTTQITDEQQRRLASAAAVAASHLLDDLRIRKAAQLPREERLRTLLDGREVTGSEIAELGLSEERGSDLLVFKPDEAGGVPVLAQLHSTVQRHLSQYSPAAVATIRDERVYALVPCENSGEEHFFIAPLLPIISRLIGPGTRVADAGTAHRSAEVSSLRLLAERLFETAERHPEISIPVLTVESLQPLLLIGRLSKLLSAEPELFSSKLKELRERDPAVVETLTAWFASFGNIASTARRLRIHENTVRYRIRRAEEEHGISLRDPDTILATWLELRAIV